MIDCVVSPVDQRLLVTDEEVSITEPPAQKVVEPLADIVGVAGVGFTVTISLAETGELHPTLVTVTVNVPDAVTVMDCVVAPFDQRFPVADEEVNTTFPPEQNVVGPPAEIVGVAGMAFTVTTVAAERGEVHNPLSTKTVNVPEVETVIDCVVSPVDQRLLLADEEVSTTEPPAQKVVEPLAEIVGVAGVGFTVTISLAETLELHPPLVTVTVNVPEAVTVMD